MKRGILTRTKYDEHLTAGVLSFSQHETSYAILENPWKDNQRNISCIPEGLYTVKRDKTGRFQWWKILDVPNRSNIEIHTGNTTGDTAGCLLPALYLIGKLGHQSRKAIHLMHDFLGEDDWILEITSL